MAQHFHLISCISTLFFLLLLVPSNSENLTAKKPKPFGFLNHLQGCKKGENLGGIRELKKYLNKFGYLNYKSINGHDNDHFDEMLEAAVKTYQANYHLKISGILDSETISKMVMPRCGFPDIINGTNSMTKKHQGHQHHSPKKLHVVAHYSYYGGSYIWPAGKTHLYYWFDLQIPSSFKQALASAFNRWAWYTQYFTFEETLDSQSSDLTVIFYSGDHGDGSPFDGPGGVIAHAFFPTDGRLHFDVDSRWSTGVPIPNYLDLESVAVHEIGHLLGLGHSTVPDAIMYPSIYYGQVKTDFHADDVQGIRALYNI